MIDTEPETDVEAGTDAEAGADVEAGAIPLPGNGVASGGRGVPAHSARGWSGCASGCASVARARAAGGPDRGAGRYPAAGCSTAFDRDVAAAAALDAARSYAVALTSTDQNSIDQGIKDLLGGATGEHQGLQPKPRPGCEDVD